MANLNYYNLQKAIYEKLIGSSSLMAIVSGVFDYPPQEVNFPFVVIADASSGDMSAIGKNIIEQQIRINIWSRELGHKQTANIMELIYVLLHNGSVAVVGQILASMRFVSTSIQLEDDGRTYQGAMLLSIILSDV